MQCFTPIAHAQTVIPNKNYESIGDVIIAAINMLGFLFGGIVVLFIIYAGFLYMTAGGDPEKLTKAKKTLLWAIVGAIIVTASFLIVNFFSDTIRCMIVTCPPSG
ncbi:MAG: pilin [Patescibacteria group bacterium]|nr:pilin [Patescibacteria group bacterium]